MAKRAGRRIDWPLSFSDPHISLDPHLMCIVAATEGCAAKAPRCPRRDRGIFRGPQPHEPFTDLSE